MMAMAMMAMSGGAYPHESYIDTRQPKPRIPDDELNRSRGLKPFDIDGKTVWAINKKNSIRKANRS